MPSVTILFKTVKSTLFCVLSPIKDYKWIHCSLKSTPVLPLNSALSYATIIFCKVIIDSHIIDR